MRRLRIELILLNFAHFTEFLPKNFLLVLINQVVVIVTQSDLSIVSTQFPKKKKKSTLKFLVVKRVL